MTHTPMNEDEAARAVYETMQWAVSNPPVYGKAAPEWAENGNSMAQDKAREVAKALQARQPEGASEFEVAKLAREMEMAYNTNYGTDGVRPDFIESAKRQLSHGHSLTNLTNEQLTVAIDAINGVDKLTAELKIQDDANDIMRRDLMKCKEALETCSNEGEFGRQKFCVDTVSEALTLLSKYTGGE